MVSTFSDETSISFFLWMETRAGKEGQSHRYQLELEVDQQRGE
jgi:hypothetical protein